MFNLRKKKTVKPEPFGLDEFEVLVQTETNQLSAMLVGSSRGIDKGCLVRSRTFKGDDVAEALSFVPGARIEYVYDEEDNLVGRKLV